MLGRRIRILGLAAAVVAVAPSPAAAQFLNESELRHAKAAFQMAETGRWRLALRLAEDVNDPALAKIIRWLDYIRPESDATFGELVAFMEANPHWPMRSRLQRRAEETLTPADPDSTVIAWFANREPTTVEGMIRLGLAQRSTGGEAKARELIRRAWVEGTFTARQEADFHKNFRQVLTHADHVRRLDRLLWEGRDDAVRRMMPRVNAGHRALAEARLAFRKGAGNVDRLIAKVPEELRDDPGLQYERLRWRRQKGRDAAAREILSSPPASLGRPDKWWDERAILARRALQEGLVSEAYRIVRNHGVASGEEFAEAEWLAGWIALRQLGDAKEALEHFTAMHRAVRYPVSLARGAYWAGRAAEALNDGKAAEEWYRRAATHPSTYYGQLAQNKLKPGEGNAFPLPPRPTNEEIEAFGRHELTRAVRLLSETQQTTWLRAFLTALSAAGETPGWRALAANLAQAYGRPDLAIAVAKRANQENHDVIAEGYPTVSLPAAPDGSRQPSVERALVYAVIRQESAFQPDAVSRAGALGLMQLMPATAHAVATQASLAYSKDRLISDPNLNIRLGQTYLARLLDDFGGSYVLTLAAYNAGPARARSWIRQNGDPRDPNVDTVDWIEMIPFEETRNYVQRVLETLHVYRSGVNGTEIAQGHRPDGRR